VADGLPPSDTSALVGAVIQAVGTIAAGLLAIQAARIGAGALKRQTDAAAARSERDRVAQDETHKQRIAGALAGEIGAIVALIERREMIAMYREYLDPRWQAVAFQHGFYPPSAPVAKEDYLVLYRSLAGEIGVLDAALCGDVAEFYVLATSIIEQLRGYDEEQTRQRLASIRAHGRGPEEEQRILQGTRVFLTDLEELVARGVPLVERLHRVQTERNRPAYGEADTPSAWPFR
jgi:hypothetical protein